MPQVDVLPLLGWFGVTAAGALVGFYVALAIRRWAQRDEPTGTFTFQDLRDMRARGEITEHEFQAMRTALLARMEIEDAEDAPPQPPDASPPGGPAPS